MNKIILTLCATFLSLFIYSQELAIQGIARNNNGAKINQNITLTFELYYLDVANNPNATFQAAKTLTTDGFGVFSTTIDLNRATESVISNNEMYLKISEGNTIISNEKLKTVPYATSALNGVPTGSIMPYMGNSAPAGWLLCDGSAIPVTDNTLALRTILGSSNTPNLKGMFLRGTGQSPVNNQLGPDLGGTQGDDIKSHSHNQGSLSTSTDGNHNHRLQHPRSDDEDSSGYVSILGDDENFGSWDIGTTNSGDHSHSISGNTGSTGDSETRPVSYGVNYIIKL